MNMRKLLLIVICLGNVYYAMSQRCSRLSYLNRKVDTLFKITPNIENKNFPVFNFYSVRDSVVRVGNGITMPLMLKNFPDDNGAYTLNFQMYVKEAKGVLFIFEDGNKNRDTIYSFSNDYFSKPISIDLKKSLESPIFNYKNLTMKVWGGAEASTVLLKDCYIAGISVDKVQGWPSRVCEVKWDLFNVDFHEFDSYGVYKVFPEDEREEEYKGELFVSIDTSRTAFQNVSDFVYKLLSHYPYYSERRVDKEVVLENYLKLINRLHAADMELRQKIKAINTFLAEKIKDPHFKIRQSKENYVHKYTPIYSYMIKNKLYVGANFDTLLNDEIPVGSEIVSVGKYSVKNFENAEQLNTFLKDVPGSSRSLEVVLPGKGKSKKVAYTIKKGYSIPEHFRPQNLKLRVFEKGDVVYLKINKIDFDLPLRLLNNYSLFQNAHKIILDYRGCSGGDFLAGAKFMTYFIEGPFDWYHIQSRFTSQIHKVVVEENKSSFNIKQETPIRILIDEKTACAAELMISSFKTYRKDVKVVGVASTLGALTLAQNFHFEEIGVTIKSNALSTGKILTAQNGSIENKGINPDILIEIDSVHSLQPYDDKVKIEAMLN